MCGGVGSRFWPYSREERPKQFLDLFGTGRSLLQMTFDRVRGLVPPERVILVTNRRYESMVREQLPEVPAENILKEPARRNTSPCICWASHHISALDPHASVLTLPSDHMILKEEAFVEALERGFRFVEEGDRLLTLGIRPTTPHTGYGYIQQGKPVDGLDGFFKVKSFTEKPALDLAKEFLASGEFYWNAGMFLWRVDSILKAFSEYAGETSRLFDEGAGLYATPEEEAFIENKFPDAPAISIDYAIMEKASNVYVETVDLGWSDVGSWQALWEVSEHDAAQNVTRGVKVIANDCRDSIFAIPEGKVVVAAGLEDFIVADCGNALLIYPKSKEQDIRRMTGEVADRFGSDFI